MLFNTHSHLDTSKQFAEDREAVLERARLAGVARLVVIGYRQSAIPVTLAFAEQHEGVYAAVGIHPTDGLEWGEEAEAALRAAAGHRLVRAIGEIGLDYYWKDSCPFETQREVFRRQIRLARELKLPIVIHDRDAHDDVVRILEYEHADEVGGVMHCFAADWEIARRCLDLGFYLGVGGTITYKSNTTVQEVIRRAPLDRLVLETDDPYLAPVPHRGKRNEPGYVRHVAEFVAGLRGEELTLIESATYANGCRLFKIEP